MSILIINKTSLKKSPYHIWLENIDEELLLLGSLDKTQGAENYDYSEFFSQYETNGTLEIRALELHREYLFHTIISSSEYDVLRAARLRECLNLEGQSYKSALAFRNKVVMKEYVQHAGISVPSFAAIEMAVDLYGFIEINGYPVVVKPISGMGSMDTTVLKNKQDLCVFLEGGIMPNYMVEKFVQGDVYHIDGAIINGEIVLAWPSRYMNNCLSFQQGEYLSSYQLEKNNPLTERLREFTAQVLDVLPTPQHTSFHAEVFHTPEDEIVFCEIASRTGGALVREAVQHTFGVDITRLSVEAQCGMVKDISDLNLQEAYPQTLTGFLLLPPQKGVLRQIKAHQLPDWIVYHKISAVAGKSYNDAKTSVEEIAKYLIVGDTEVEVAGRISQVAGWMSEALDWDFDSE